MEQFNVLTWNFNSDSIEHYDVIPYFVRAYNERKKRAKRKSFQKASEEYRKTYGVPETHEEFMDFVKDESMYMFWSRCEWEMIVHGWPAQKNEYKIDVHEQVMMNIGHIADIVMSEVSRKNKRKKTKLAGKEGE